MEWQRNLEQARSEGRPKFKKENAVSKLSDVLPLKISISITEGKVMENLSFKVSPMFAFKVIGFERIFTFEEAYKEIPKFWNEICEKYWKIFTKVYRQQLSRNRQSATTAFVNTVFVLMMSATENSAI